MVAALLVSTRNKPRPPQHRPGLQAHGTTTSRAGAGATGQVSLPVPGHTPNQVLPEGKAAGASIPSHFFLQPARRCRAARRRSRATGRFHVAGTRGSR